MWRASRAAAYFFFSLVGSVQTTCFLWKWHNALSSWSVCFAREDVTSQPSSKYSSLSNFAVLTDVTQRVWRMNRIRRTLALVRASAPAVRSIVFSMRSKAAAARKVVARRHQTQAADLIRAALRVGGLQECNKIVPSVICPRVTMLAEVNKR